MGNKEARATTQNTGFVDVNRPLPTAALNIAWERTQLKVSNLEALKEAGKELLTKMTDLDIDLTDADVNSQNTQEALAMLKNCPQLKALRLKMPEFEL